MTGFRLHVQRLAGAEVVTSRVARRAVMVLTFTLLTAFSAYAMVPLPVSPVPVTLQTMVVILAGALLGPWLGAASQVVYLAAGAAGMPVFAGGAAGVAWLLGNTGGYLLAFPAAAALVGVLAGPVGALRSEGRLARGIALARLGGALALGTALILAGGAAQLTLLTGDPERAIAIGVAPFLLGALLKIFGALLVAARLRGRTLGLV